jgi:integrase
VTTVDVERWYGKLRDGEKPLGIRSVRGCRTALSAMFTAAVRWGYLPMSPVERARMPKGPKWNPRSPEPKHVASRIVAAEAKDRDLGVFARMAVAIGARRGELAGLRWSAIDFEQGLVRIDSAVVSTDGDNTGKRTGARLETRERRRNASGASRSLQLRLAPDRQGRRRRRSRSPA